MKKAIFFFVLALVFCSILPGISENHTYSTERPDAFQFCELYMKRMIEFENSSGVDLSSSLAGIGGLNLFPDYNDGLMRRECLAGTLAFDPDTFIVDEWDKIFMYLGGDPQKSLRLLLEATIAISTLEYDMHDEMRMSYIEGTTPVVKVYEEFIGPLSSDIEVTARKTKAQGNRKLVYQGKYKYYISIMEINEGNEIVSIFAE